MEYDQHIGSRAFLKGSETLDGSSFWLHRTGHNPVRSNIRLARIENAPELALRGVP